MAFEIKVFLKFNKGKPATNLFRSERGLEKRFLYKLPNGYI